MKRKLAVAGLAIVGLVAATGLALFALENPPGAPGPVVTVYKSPTCGCCKKWVTHLRDNGFRVEAVDLNDVVSKKIEHGLKPELASCHTALVDGYVVEGHVPADDIRRLLRERPSVRGLAVPGMPIGSPGMEQDGRKEPYEVLAFDQDGETHVFSRR